MCCAKYTSPYILKTQHVCIIMGSGRTKISLQSIGMMQIDWLGPRLAWSCANPHWLTGSTTGMILCQSSLIDWVHDWYGPLPILTDWLGPRLAWSSANLHWLTGSTTGMILCQSSLIDWLRDWHDPLPILIDWGVLQGGSMTVAETAIDATIYVRCPITGNWRKPIVILLRCV